MADSLCMPPLFFSGRMSNILILDRTFGPIFYMVRDHQFIGGLNHLDMLAKCVGFTRLPDSFRVLFKGMPALFLYRHQVIFQWLVLMHMVLSGPKTLKGLSLVAPFRIAEWRFRRLLCAGYWSLYLLLRWLAEETLKSFPPPKDKVAYVVSDGSKKEKRGVKNPAAQMGRTSRNEACFFGIRFVVLMVHWDVYRLPVDFRIVLRKEHPAYKTENELFREMLGSFKPPRWAKIVIVTADAAFASKANMQPNG